jgi:hypothetical protein
VKVLLVAAMAVGSVLMWLGVPIGLVYLASRMADSPQPSMGPYLLIIFGLPIGMAIIGKGLGILDRKHRQVSGIVEEKPRQATWLRSLRGDRQPNSRYSVLDVVMVWSVCTAGLLMARWFFFIAGSSLPTQ